MVKLVYACDFALEELYEFLAPKEAYCVQLFERLEEAAKKGVFNASREFICLAEDKKIIAVIFVSFAGLVLHCIDSDRLNDAWEQCKSLLEDFFAKKSVYCVSGAALGTQFIVQVLSANKNQTLIERRPYYLMLHDARRCLPSKCVSFPVEVCTAGDLENLLPLQRSYEAIEVLPQGIAFDEELCKKVLKKNILLGRVFAIRKENSFAAKAAINAASAHFFQIGGVFTVPEARRNGYASCLVNYISAMARELKQNTVLFVRQKNFTAIHAYENSGFYRIGEYEIVYFQKQ